MSTQFPRLRELNLSNSQDNQSLYHLIQPRLQSFLLGGEEEHDCKRSLPAEVLRLLGERCGSSLQRLELGYNAGKHPRGSGSALVACLRRLQALTYFDLQPVHPYRTEEEEEDSGDQGDNRPVISFELLQVNAYHPSLKEVLLTFIPLNCILGLPQASPDPGVHFPFSNLEGLRMRTDHNALMYSLPYLWNLKSLNIVFHDQFLDPLVPHSYREDILAGFSNFQFPRLESLTLDLESTVITRSNFFSFISSMPMLKRLYFRATRCKSFGLSDVDMIQLIELLPEIESLAILPSASILKAETVLAFGKNCPNLRTLRLTAKVSFDRLISQSTPGEYWPDLELLDIGLGFGIDRDRDQPICPDPMTSAPLLLS